MTISPALMVLSCCDSGRGMVKADGILGMARAFIIAGGDWNWPASGEIDIM